MRMNLLLLAVMTFAALSCGPAAAPPTPPGATKGAGDSAIATVPVEYQREGGDSAKVIDYVAPEIFPDLTTLVAASDLVLRGRALEQDRFAVTDVLVSRLGVEAGTVRLRLIQQPPDAPPLHSDPPLTPGQEYFLFARAFWSPLSDQFRRSHTFRPIGGPQGQWLVPDGRVVQEAEVPLKARSGETAERFAAEVKGSPDLRGMAASLLWKYGWKGRETYVRMETVPSVMVLEGSAYYRATLEASRVIGLDFASYAGRPALWMNYQLEPDGLQGCVLVADGAVRGAWLRVEGTDRIVRLDHREEALGAATNPRVSATPTPILKPLDQPDPAGSRPETPARPTTAPAQ